MKTFGDLEPGDSVWKFCRTDRNNLKEYKVQTTVFMGDYVMISLDDSGIIKKFPPNTSWTNIGLQLEIIYFSDPAYAQNFW